MLAEYKSGASTSHSAHLNVASAPTASSTPPATTAPTTAGAVSCSGSSLPHASCDAIVARLAEQVLAPALEGAAFCQLEAMAAEQRETLIWSKTLILKPTDGAPAHSDSVRLVLALLPSPPFILKPLPPQRLLLPMLLATECCANCFTASCNNALGVACEAVMTFAKELKSIG